MKKLSIEEKAKAYDEAVERAESIYNETAIPSATTKGICTYIFPELKESEDEKIRKAIVWCIDTVVGELGINEPEGFPISKLKSWLEKQDKSNMGISETTKQELEDNLNKALEKETPESFNKFLDEQNPADKVEQKFHEGEWITNSDYTWKIVEVKPLDYILQSQDGNIVDDTISHVDEQFHSFTIEDAKDGDVLAYSDGSLTIFRYRLSGLDAGLYMSHVLLTDKIEFKQTCSINNVHPATKEQRDTLMKAMADAGYTFDFEKKELKKIDWNPQPGDIFRKKGTISPTYHLCAKQEDGITFDFVENREVGIAGGEITIFALKNDYELVERLKPIKDVIEKELNKELQTKVEQKSSWSEEDNKMSRFIGNAITADDASIYLKSKGIQIIDAHIWLEKLKERVLPQPKREWSEEDDYNLQCCIAKVQSDIDNGRIGRNRELLTWLNSLKKRVQPKQEWSEEDEYTLGETIQHLEELIRIDKAKHCACDVQYYQRDIDWLKSLKEKYTWKPRE